MIQRFLCLPLAERLLAGTGIEIVLLNETGSTNDDLKGRARQHAFEHPVLEVAYAQRAARGTKGRGWRTVESGLYFSLGIPIDQQRGLSAIVAGLAVVSAARRFGIELYLKWPNDLWADGGKAGGILCEAVRDRGGLLSLVIGIGCNLKTSQAAVTTNGWPVRDFCSVGGEALLTSAETRTTFLAAIVLSLLERFEELSEGGLDMREDWASADAFFGRSVVWTNDGKEVQRGIDRGIDKEGRLMLEPLNGVGEGTGHCCLLSGELCALKNIVDL